MFIKTSFYSVVNHLDAV